MQVITSKIENNISVKSHILSYSKPKTILCHYYPYIKGCSGYQETKQKPSNSDYAVGYWREKNKQTINN